MPRWGQKVKHQGKGILFTGGDNHSDLDSDAANATDAKFSEILWNKQSSLGDPRVFTLKQQDNGAETDSIRTEDFETAFQKSLPADYSLKTYHSQSLAGESTDTPLTEDFEDRFRSTLKHTDSTSESYRLPAAPGFSGIPVRTTPGSRATPVNRRYPTSTSRHTPPPLKRTAPKNLGYTGITASKLADDNQIADTFDELSDLEPDGYQRMRPTSPHHAAPIVSNGCYEADSESEDGDFAQQIREQSSRIQKEIELERRLKTRQAQRVANQSVPITDSAGSGRSGYNSVDSRHHTQPRYRGSGSFTHLSSAQGLHAFHSYSASTPDMTNLFTAQQASSLMKSQMEEDSNTIKRLNSDRMGLLQEVNKLQEQLKKLEEEVSSTELQAKENRARAEESRSHLMVAEFKKEAVLKEISRLNAEVEQGKRIIEEAEERKKEEDDILNSLGVTMQQMPSIVKSRDELQAEVENLQKAGEKEKDERSKEVQSVKTEASVMQDQMQEKIDELRDSVQRLNTHLERVTMEKDEYKKERDAAVSKCESLQRDMTAGEQAKAQALEQTIKGYDDMRRRLEKESAEVNVQLSNELKGSKKLLEIEEQKCCKLREEITLRDQLNTSLREQLHDVRQKSIEEEDSHDKLLKELKQQLREAESNKLAAWDTCKQQFDVEKDKLLEATRDDLQREHTEMLSAVKEEYSRHIAQLQHNAKNKENEAHLLRDRLSDQEQEHRKALETLKIDIREQIEQAVRNEKKIWEKEQKYQESEHLRQFREKEENQLEQVKFQLEAESRKREQVEDLLSNLKSELEDTKQYSQKLDADKQTAAQKLKNAENSRDDALAKLRKELKQHYDKIISALREEISDKDQELERLKEENAAILQSEAETAQTLEKFEKMIIHEINEECKKTADLLGVQPRKAQTVSFSRSSSPSKMKARKRSTSRSLTASAVANLRACNEELRNSLAEVKSEAEDLSNTIEKSEKIKELELDTLRNRLNNEKRQEIEDMKTTLAKMPVCRRSLTEPKDPYQIKLERRASEKAVKKSLSGSYTKVNGLSPPDFAMRPTEEAQEAVPAYSVPTPSPDRLKHIRAGSPFRYKSNPLLSSSVNDITKYSSSQNLSSAGMDSLEQKVRLAELKARLADERANRNQAMLSQKMQEVNELQQTLNHQTKEIMGLERSYDDLRSAQYAPNRYSMLNNTFPH